MQYQLPLKKFSFLILLCCLLDINAIMAQNDTQEKNSHPLYKAQMSYLSNTVYNGRKDSLPVPYVTPSFKYLDKSGFFVNTGISFLASNYAQRIDLFTIEAGYEKEIIDNLNLEIAAEKDFYNKNSVSVRSEIAGSLSADIAFNNDYINLSAGTYAMFTTGNVDYTINLGASHDFSFDDDQWSIEPSFNTNFGTMNYYDKYISKRQTKTGKKSKGSSTTTTNGTTTVTTTTTVSMINPGQFKLMDYELSLPVYYYGKKWGFFCTPTFAIPESPASYNTSVKTTTTINGVSSSVITKTKSQEQLSDLFFIEAGVSLKF